MKLTIEAAPGELAARLDDLRTTLERIASRSPGLHKGESVDLLIPELRQAKERAQVDVEKIRARLEARLLELVR